MSSRLEIFEDVLSAIARQENDDSVEALLAQCRRIAKEALEHKAGRYSEAEARSICQHGQCIAVPVAAAEALALSTPYYRQSNGKLAKLYDGGPHRPVPNSREAWTALMAANIVSAPRWTKPTPIGAKARAIYLDEVPA